MWENHVQTETDGLITNLPENYAHLMVMQFDDANDIIYIIKNKMTCSMVFSGENDIKNGTSKFEHLKPLL